MQDTVLIFSIGMITSVGLDSKQTTASVKAGISRFIESSILDKHFEPFMLSIVPDEILPSLKSEIEKEKGITSRQIRMLRLATLPLQEALSNIPNVKTIPLFLGVPEQLHNQLQPVDEQFFELLSAQSEIVFNTKKSKIIPQGRTAGLVALNEAKKYISSDNGQLVVVGGVDTYVDLSLLSVLDMEDRILSSNTLDGFVPGEGACFLLVGSSDKSTDVGKSPLVTIQASSTGYEKGHLYSEEVHHGDGLSETFQKVFSSDKSSVGKAKTVYAGLNGENFGAKEWGVAYMRNIALFEDDLRIDHPADCFGDTGAALGPIMVGLAVINMQKNLIEGPCLIWCSSDYGPRAAVVVDIF